MDKALLAPVIRRVVDPLVRDFSPLKIYLFSHKIASTGETTSFKLLMVLDTADKEAVQRKAYLDIECDAPFDIVVYTPAEWEMLVKDTSSFAGKISRTGVVLYG